MFNNIFEKFKGLVNKSSENDKNLICNFVKNGLIFDQNRIIKVCAKDNQIIDKRFILTNEFNGLWINEDEILSKIKSLNSMFTSETIPSSCKDCCYLVPNIKKKNKAFDFIYLNHWTCCFLNCKYCNRDKVDEIAKCNHYDIMPIINQLIDSGLITKETKIIFGCGDATLHPDFDKLMYFFINYEMKNIEIHTSAQRYCHSISEAMAKGIAKIVVSLDSGCPYIYGEIKGSNKYDIAISNIKRYLDFQDKKEKQIIINYTLVEHINDNQKEILDWFVLSRGLGVRHLSMDIDEKWYNNINGSIPPFLKDLIIFSKRMSEYNNINFEFSHKLQSLYEKIKQES